MTVNNDRLAFSSEWEIDQLVKSSEKVVSSGNTALVSFRALGLPALPVFEVYFKPSGSLRWFKEGLNTKDGTFAGFFSFYSYILDGSLIISTQVSGTARYFLWQDKVDY